MISCDVLQMEAAVLRFDAELLLLRHEKLQLDGHLKLADLQHLTLVEELLLIKEFEKMEESLQEKLNARMEEENNVMVQEFCWIVFLFIGSVSLSIDRLTGHFLDVNNHVNGSQ